jgi:hypothetical protein
MIEAGLQAFVDWDAEHEDPASLIADMYRAMAAARPS